MTRDVCLFLPFEKDIVLNIFYFPYGYMYHAMTRARIARFLRVPPLNGCANKSCFLQHATVQAVQ